MDIEFTMFTTDTQWVEGVVNDDEYRFVAKLFDVGSHHGINQGRVSKLSITHGLAWDRCFVNYDRGWDVRPKTRDEEEVFVAVVDFLEDAPIRFGGE